MRPLPFTACAVFAIFLAGILAGCQDSGDVLSQGKGAERPPHLVETVPVAQQEIAYSTTLTGTLYARRQVRLFNQEEGRIDELPVFEGDVVRQGELLLRLDDRLLRAEMEKAAATLAQAKTDLRRIETVVAKRLAPEDELARARTAVQVAKAEMDLLRTRLEYTELRAPFDGVITERLAEPGDVAPRHTHLISLADPDSLFTELNVSELLLPALSPGDPVEVRIDALGDVSGAGQIARIHPTVNASTRQGKVEVNLTKIPPGASAGQLGRVTLRTRISERQVLPFAALRRDPEGEYVFVVNGENRAERRGVRTGLRLGELVEVVEGVQTGESVVVRGFLGLNSGKQVRLPEATADTGSQEESETQPL